MTIILFISFMGLHILGDLKIYFAPLPFMEETESQSSNSKRFKK